MNNQTNKLNNTAITHVDLAPNAHLNSSQSGSLNSSSILHLELQLANCYESKPLELDDEVTLYRVYTRELNGELCTE